MGRVLLCSTAVGLALAFATPAFAQQSDADASLSDTNDIIVTAQKRGESINDVPMVIAAISGEELGNRQIMSGTELVKIVPDLHVVSQYGPYAQTFTLRGIGPANQYNFNVLQPVGAYMDENFQGFSPSPGIQLFDLERVEVLKGPQGTLYGRNTTGGAINFITRNPDLSRTGSNLIASAGYGNRNAYFMQAATDIVFAPDKFGVRLAFSHSDADGYMNNVGAVGPKHFGGGSNTQGRVTFAYDSGNGLDAKLKVYLNDFHGEMAGALAFGIGPGNTNLGGFSRDGLSNRDVTVSYYRPNTNSSIQTALDVNWESGPWKLTSITSYQDSKAQLSSDCDGSPAELCAHNLNMDGTQLSQDFRVGYENGGFDILAGLSGAHDTYNQTANTGFFDTAFIRGSYRQTRDTYGAYADGTYAFDDRLSLTLGARYTHDKLKLSKVHTDYTDSLFGNPVASAIPGGAYVPGAFLPTRVETSSGVSGRAILKYEFARNQQVYASYSRGYRSGAYNGTFYFSPDEVNYVGPEKVDNFEIGAKLGLLDGRLQFNVTLFENKIHNQQILTSIDIPPCLTCNPPTPGAQVTGVGGLDGRIRGADIEMKLKLLDSLQARATINLLDSKYDDGPSQLVSGINVSGNDFAFVSKVSVVGGLEWTAWEGRDSRVILNGDASYNSRYYFNPENGENSTGPRGRGGQPGYVLLDGSVRWTNDKYGLQFWMKNITNKYYVTALIVAEASFGEEYLFRGAPRSYGVTASVNF